MPDDSEQSVKCGRCGMPIEDSPNLQEEDRTPCPNCGSMSRNFTVRIGVTIKVNDGAFFLHERKARSIAFGESPREGVYTNATLEPDTQLKFSLSGRSPQGEEDTLPACRVLAQRLRQDDAAFSDPERAEGQLDCVIRHSGDQRRTLGVQVVRAVVDTNLWRTLSVKGAVTRDLPVTEAATAIKDAVMVKASERKIPTKDRRAITLALDATRLPGLAFEAVVDQFRADHGVWVKELGFSAVWLVGPTPRLVWRLDEPVMS